MKGKGWRDREIRKQCTDRVREKVKRGNVAVSESDRPSQNKERKQFAVLNRYSSLLCQIEEHRVQRSRKRANQTDGDRCTSRGRETQLTGV